MLLSIALILLVGMSMGWICRKIKLPGLLGMLITGIVLGPYVLNMLDIKLLGISADLRKIALIIILTRAGLGLDLTSLKKIGRPAVLMCFVPATFELAGMLLLAPRSGGHGRSACGSIACGRRSAHGKAYGRRLRCQRGDSAVDSCGGIGR